MLTAAARVAGAGVCDRGGNAAARGTDTPTMRMALDALMRLPRDNDSFVLCFWEQVGTQMTVCWHVDNLKMSKVMINMIKYIKNIIVNFPEEIVAIRMSPAADRLFTVRDKSLAKPLPNEQARAFCHASAQLLFLCTRARQDIQPATGFFTTQVRCPYDNDWGKVKQLLCITQP